MPVRHTINLTTEHNHPPMGLSWATAHRLLHIGFAGKGRPGHLPEGHEQYTVSTQFNSGGGGWLQLMLEGYSCQVIQQHTQSTVHNTVQHTTVCVNVSIMGSNVTGMVIVLSCM